MSNFADRLAEIQQQIAEAAGRSGRYPEGVTLVAVSKGHPPESIREAVGAGQTLFGESRVQEARAKIAASPVNARWHFIGHLQRNKIRPLLPLCEAIESVDSLELARDLDRIAAESGSRPRVLLEVNVSAEGSKFGFSPARLREDMEDLLGLPRLQLEGLMTVPPVVPEADEARPFFAALREFRDELQASFSVALPVLSMGMSSDFPVAIEEGATLVRVGTALFGRRP